MDPAVDKKEQIKQIRTAQCELRKLLESSLKGPRAKDNVAFLNKLVAEAEEEYKIDHAIYLMRIWNFSCDQFYQAELENLRADVSRIEGIELTNDDSQSCI